MFQALPLAGVSPESFSDFFVSLPPLPSFCPLPTRRGLSNVYPNPGFQTVKTGVPPSLTNPHWCPLKRCPFWVSPPCPKERSLSCSSLPLCFVSSSPSKRLDGSLPFASKRGFNSLPDKFFFSFILLFLRFSSPLSLLFLSPFTSSYWMNQPPPPPLSYGVRSTVPPLAKPFSAKCVVSSSTYWRFGDDSDNYPEVPLALCGEFPPFEVGTFVPAIFFPHNSTWFVLRPNFSPHSNFLTPL